METIFDYRKPSLNNRLSFFSRFLKLELSKYINEFELIIEVYGMKSVNIDCQKFILKLNEYIKVINILILMLRKILNYQLKGYNSS